MNKKNIIIVIIVISAVGAYFGKLKYDSMLKATSEGLALGKAYGKIINQNQCMLGLKLKYTSCATVECELSANGYISGCMNKAVKDEFCNNVPSFNDTEQALAWVSKSCADYSLGNGKCLKYMHKFISVCTEQKEGKKLSKREHFESGYKKGISEK